MTDKVQKIREEVVRMHNLLPVMDGDNISVNYADRILTTLEMYIDYLQEEPVSKDLEEAARRIATRHSHITGDTYYANDAWFFKKGAQWQKEQMINKACEWLKSYRQDTPDGIGYIAGIIDDKTIKEFKQAMEE